MDLPVIIGNKRSKLYFNAIEIFKDRIEGKALLLPKKNIYFQDVLYWTEINKKIKNTNIIWCELTIYTSKTKYSIESLRWENYNEIKAFITKGKERNLEKEKKIYNSFWS